MAYLAVHNSRSVRDERGSGENEGKLLTGQSFFPRNAVSACSGYFVLLGVYFLSLFGRFPALR